MKKLLLDIVTAIIIISCGISIYYIVRNDENIYSTSEASNIYMNVNEEISIPVVHDSPNAKTSLSVESNSESVEVNVENWTITAKQPGVSKVTVSSSNTNFGPFEILLTIGNGSLEYPYYIRNEEDLSHIGKNDWSLGDSYRLVNNIDLTKPFTPIGTTATPFCGELDGSINYYSINNLIINETSADKSQPVGLFTCIGENGKVENIIIKNSNVTSASKFAGIIAGRNYGLIGKCQVIDSSITNTNQGNGYTGVICGLNESKQSYAQVRLCTTKATLESSYVGGGIVGYNKGGVISNNNAWTTTVKMNPSSENKENSLFGGIAGFSMNGTNNIASVTIVNNLISINTIVSNGVKIGGLFGETLSENVDSRGYYSMLLYNIPLSISPVGINKNDNVLSSTSTSARNYVANITKTEKNRATTYKAKKDSTWDLSNIWTVSTDSFVNINYINDKFDYQVLPTQGLIMEISSQATLNEAINYMKNYPSANITYKIMGESITEDEKDADGNIKLDENGSAIQILKEKTYTYNAGENWSPIGTKEVPFAGKIIAEKDATITISGLKVANKTYSGFFGYLSKDAEINNLIINGADISGIMVGAVTGYNAGGVIANCKIQGLKANTTKYAGSIAGFSSGTINNCIVNLTSILVNKEDEKNIYLGGIVGKSRGLVTHCNIDSLDINVDFESKNNTACIGGVVGFIENANIEDCEVSSFATSSYRYEGRTYGGGICGYLVSSKIIKSGIIESQQIKLNKTNSSSIVGGLAGFIDEYSKVTQSSVGSVILISYNSAGLVSFCMGEISQCYTGSTTIIEGNYVGGLACNLYGQIKDSYSISEFRGKNMEAGLVTYLWKGSQVMNCYTYCKYSGVSNKAYADTSVNYKSRQDLYGQINNSIIVGSESQELAKPTVTDFYKKTITCRDGANKVEVQITYIFLVQKFNYCVESELTGQKDVYNLFESLDFSHDIWLFEAETVNNSPILKDAYNSGFGVITQTLTSDEDLNERNLGEDVA